MKRSISYSLLISYVILGSITSACSSSQSESIKGTFEQSDINANELYTANCAICHGNNREGLIGPALNPNTLEALSDSQVKTIISDGKGRMPSWKSSLSSQEIDALVQLIKHRSTN